MIALRDGLPPIELENGHTVAFEKEWLVRALNVAAQRAGYAQWWLATHIAESVRMWLGALDDQRLIPSSQLTRAVCAALELIGYQEIGNQFEAAAPFARISLVEVAQEAGNGYELAFFTTLGRRLQEALELGGNYCELIGLEPCVKLLQHRKAWSPTCEALRSEIVTFAREQTEHRCLGEEAATGRELYLHLE